MKYTNTSAFIDWIDEFGNRELAKRLGIHVSTISQWRRGACWPAVRHMRKIRKLSKERITYEHIIDGTGA